MESIYCFKDFVSQRRNREPPREVDELKKGCWKPQTAATRDQAYSPFLKKSSRRRLRPNRDRGYPRPLAVLLITETSDFCAVLDDSGSINVAAGNHKNSTKDSGSHAMVIIEGLKLLSLPINRG